MKWLLGPSERGVTEVGTWSVEGGEVGTRSVCREEGK